jgi:hypothetical protein
MVNSLRVGASLAVRANFLECRGDLAIGCAASIAGRQELTSRGEGRSTLPECVVGVNALNDRLYGRAPSAASSGLNPAPREPIEALLNGAASYPALFQQKAIALADELQRQLPLSRIVGVPTDVRAVTDLFKSDLVIDATGEEPVSEMLNERRIVQGTTTPLMHAWILGNGEADQVLWADRLNYACYRCLRVINRDGRSEARFPVLKHEPERKQIGCHAFTPLRHLRPDAGGKPGVRIEATSPATADKRNGLCHRRQGRLVGGGWVGPRCNGQRVCSRPFARANKIVPL